MQCRTMCDANSKNQKAAQQRNRILLLQSRGSIRTVLSRSPLQEAPSYPVEYNVRIDLRRTQVRRSRVRATSDPPLH
jgi:hypothetical protein